MALIPATQLRVGMLINYQNDLYRTMPRQLPGVT